MEKRATTRGELIMTSRRQHKNSVITIVATTIIVSAVAKRGPQLTVVTAESSKAKLVENVWNPFEKKTKIKINGIIEPKLSLQNNFKVSSKKADVIEFSQSNAVTNNDDGKLEKLDFKKLRNFKYLSSDNQKLARKTNSIPYMVEATNIIYDPQTASAVDFLGELWDQANFQKIALPDNTLPLESAMIYMGDDYVKYKSTSSYVGHSIEDDGNTAFGALKLLQPNAKLYRNMADLKKQFETKQINMAIVDSTTAITMRQDNPKLKLSVWGPDNYANYRMLSIVKGTKNKAAAYKYLDNRIAQSVQSRVSKTMNELPVNQEAQKSDANFSTYGSDALVTLDYSYLNEHRTTFNKRWNEIFV